MGSHKKNVTYTECGFHLSFRIFVLCREQLMGGKKIFRIIVRCGNQILRVYDQQTKSKKLKLRIFDSNRCSIVIIENTPGRLCKFNPPNLKESLAVDCMT